MAFLWHGFHGMDSSPSWHDSITQFLQSYRLFMCLFMPQTSHIPNVFGFRTSDWESIKLIVMFMKPVRKKDFCDMVHLVAIKRWWILAIKESKWWHSRDDWLVLSSQQKVCQQNNPHIVTRPPPTWTVGTRQVLSIDSFCCASAEIE